MEIILKLHNEKQPDQPEVCLTISVYIPIAGDNSQQYALTGYFHARLCLVMNVDLRGGGF